MNTIQLAQIVSESIAAVGIIAAGLGYFWGNVIIGRNKATKEDYKLLETRLNTLQKLCEDQQKELTTLHQDIGRLQGINQEKDKKIDELTSLLQNRDPNTIEYMKFVRESILEFKKEILSLVDYQKSMDSKMNIILSKGAIT